MIHGEHALLGPMHRHLATDAASRLAVSIVDNTEVVGAGRGCNGASSRILGHITVELGLELHAARNALLGGTLGLHDGRRALLAHERSQADSLASRLVK